MLPLLRASRAKLTVQHRASNQSVSPASLFFKFPHSPHRSRPRSLDQSVRVRSLDPFQLGALFGHLLAGSSSPLMSAEAGEKGWRAAWAIDKAQRSMAGPFHSHTKKSERCRDPMSLETRLQACSKLELLALVQSQLSKWPKDVQFSKKLRKNEYIVQLLDLANGFVTYWPPPTSIPPLSTLPPQLAEMLANQPPPPSLTPRVDALTLPELLEYFGMDHPQPASLTPLVDTLSAMLAPAAGPSSNPSLLPPPPPPSAPPPLSQHNDISSQLGGPLLSPFSSPPPPDRLSKGKESTNVDLSNPQDVGLEFSKPPPEFLEVQDSELKLVVDSEVHNRIAVPSPDAQSSSSTKPIRNKSSNTARRSRSPYSPSTSRIQHLNPIIDLESLASGSRHNPVELDGDDNDDNDNDIVILQPSKKLLKSRKIELVDPELQSLIRAEDGFNVFASAKGKVLLNRTIMSQWLFADRMVTKYKNYVLSSGHLVRRYQIIRALGYEASWGRQARDGAKLINVYGPAGLHPAPEVIAKLDAKEPSGAGPLLDYLRSYADAHPIN